MHSNVYIHSNLGLTAVASGRLPSRVSRLDLPPTGRLDQVYCHHRRQAGLPSRLSLLLHTPSVDLRYADYITVLYLFAKAASHPKLAQTTL